MEQGCQRFGIEDLDVGGGGVDELAAFQPLQSALDCAHGGLQQLGYPCRGYGEADVAVFVLPVGAQEKEEEVDDAFAGGAALEEEQLFFHRFDFPCQELCDAHPELWVLSGVGFHEFCWEGAGMDFFQGDDGDAVAPLPEEVSQAEDVARFVEAQEHFAFPCSDPAPDDGFCRPALDAIECRDGRAFLQDRRLGWENLRAACSGKGILCRGAELTQWVEPTVGAATADEELLLDFCWHGSKHDVVGAKLSRQGMGRQ